MVRFLSDAWAEARKRQTRLANGVIGRRGAELLDFLVFASLVGGTGALAALAYQGAVKPWFAPAAFPLSVLALWAAFHALDARLSPQWINPADPEEGHWRFDLLWVFGRLAIIGLGIFFIWTFLAYEPPALTLPEPPPDAKVFEFELN